jgi:hypothetical protein
LLQKLTYLNALFAVVEQEQSSLLLKLKQQQGTTTIDDDECHNVYDLFWEHVTFAEQSIDESSRSSSSMGGGVSQPRDTQGNDVDEDEVLLTNAIEKCQLYTDQTKLLDSLIWRLHLARATVRIEKLSIGSKSSHDPNAVSATKDTKATAAAKSGLADIDYCIANADEDGASVSIQYTCDPRTKHHSPAQLHFLRAKALFSLGTNSTTIEEAKASFGKAILLDPSKHAEWSAELGGGNWVFEAPPVE